jgi:glycerol-3-phosphate dehydrogenase
MKGTTLSNYTEFVDFIKNDQGKIEGAILFDKIKKKQFKVKSKVVVNCAGIQGDSLRQLDNPEARARMTGARGTHLTFK